MDYLPTDLLTKRSTYVSKVKSFVNVCIYQSISNKLPNFNMLKKNGKSILIFWMILPNSSIFRQRISIKALQFSKNLPNTGKNHKTAVSWILPTI